MMLRARFAVPCEGLGEAFLAIFLAESNGGMERCWMAKRAVTQKLACLRGQRRLTPLLILARTPEVVLSCRLFALSSGVFDAAKYYHGTAHCCVG